ncbi:MAG: methyltransferase domain-containing protein [Caldilineaceae bacterium]|nr:methyltransferase domain-containing protein [Caldilineaceae bacterium]
MSKELVQKQFGAHAEAYATSRVHAQGASLKRLVELIQPQADWHVLDVATAAGHTAYAFAPHVAHVTATDLTPEMIPVAAKLAAERGITNLTLETADAEELPYGDASFDLVTCRIAPHHFPHIDRFVSEAVRVLRPNGLLAVVDNVVPNDPPAGDYINAFEKLRDPSHGRALSVEEWLAAFEQAGLTVILHETAPKSMEFTPWAERMGATPEVIAELRRRLLEAPPSAADFFKTYMTEQDLFFNLDEAIILGRKA